ncbi:MAG: mannonate dehydratase [Sphaerochaetaceae bacterium]|nr:mannonate dehydratase [Sphaerochaetaceae bacterium]MDC7247167.1 mannonate dehydratase [Sphaerochaetaceae bacterium]
MKMSLRWFTSHFDKVTLPEIRQIPGVEGVVTALTDLPAGQVWPKLRIRQMMDDLKQHGLNLLAIESVNVHDSIKAGTEDRDFYIERYIETLKMLSEFGVDLVCYNFMPIFDWTRTDLAKPREDGSTVLSYDHSLLSDSDPNQIIEEMRKKQNDYILPGWEKERLDRLQQLFAIYENIDENKLYENLVYFLNAVIPECEAVGIRMAIHPDDPPWPVFGLPRIVKNASDLKKIIEAVDSPSNCVTLCTGSLGSDPRNDVPSIIRSLKGKIAFAHVRNVKHVSEGVFEESAHYQKDGSLNMYEIMKAFVDIGFDGVMRPDHGRAIWEETSVAGYGLYDRALGSQYLFGLYDAIMEGR